MNIIKSRPYVKLPKKKYLKSSFILNEFFKSNAEEEKKSSNSYM